MYEKAPKSEALKIIPKTSLTFGNTLYPLWRVETNHYVCSFQFCAQINKKYSKTIFLRQKIVQK